MKKPLSHTQAAQNLLSFARADRLRQGVWLHRLDDGQPVADLIGAATGATGPGQCPGRIIPGWLQCATVALFDGLPAVDVQPIARRYAFLMARWGALHRSAWLDIFARWSARMVTRNFSATAPLDINRVSTLREQLRTGFHDWQALERAIIRAALSIAGIVAPETSVWESDTHPVLRDGRFQAAVKTIFWSLMDEIEAAIRPQVAGE